MSSVTYARLRESDPILDAPRHPWLDCFCRTLSAPVAKTVMAICSLKLKFYVSDGLQWYQPAPIQRFDDWMHSDSPEWSVIKTFPTVIGTIYHLHDPVIVAEVLKHFRGDDNPDSLLGYSITAGLMLTTLKETFGHEFQKNDLMFTCSQELSKFYRERVSRLMTTQAVKNYRETIREEANATLDRWIHRSESTGSFNIYDAGEFPCGVITRLLLGERVGNSELSQAVRTVNWFLIYRIVKKNQVTPEEQERYDAALKVIREAIVPLLNDPDVPLFSVLEGEEPLTDIQKESLAFLIFFAGQETTGFFLGNLYLYYALRPGEQSHIRDLLKISREEGRKGLDYALNYIFAKFPPAYVAGRKLKNDKSLSLDLRMEGETQIRTVVIPGGSVLSPRFIPTAQKVIETAPGILYKPGAYRKWFPFGNGAHHCPGRYLALEELTEMILTTIERTEITTKEEREPEVEGWITLQFKTAHHVSFRPLPSSS